MDGTCGGRDIDPQRVGLCNDFKRLLTPPKNDCLDFKPEGETSCVLPLLPAQHRGRILPAGDDILAGLRL